MRAFIIAVLGAIFLPKGFFTKIFLGVIAIWLICDLMSPATPRPAAIMTDAYSHGSQPHVVLQITQPDNDHRQTFSITNDSDFRIEDIWVKCVNVDGSDYHISTPMVMSPHETKTEGNQDLFAESGAVCKITGMTSYRV